MGYWGRAIRIGLLLPLVAIAEARSGESEEAPEESQSWNLATQFLFQEAHESFRSSAQNSRERRLGEALTLLVLQPRTNAKIRQAQQELQNLATENPQDPAGKAARFFLARIEEMHAAKPDLERARDSYLLLLADGDGDPFSEMAASRIVLIDLYGASESPEKISEVIEDLRPIGDLLRTDSGKREFFTNQGFALVELGGDPRTAMESLIAADEIGQPLPMVDADALLVIGGLAESLGETAIARKYYKKFVARYRMDNRRYSVERFLEKLPPE